ncbi:MAG: alpha,alpha-trehalose-phosphate synthase (UDP-forming), partial [Gammaproteobacteria bacterium]
EQDGIAFATVPLSAHDYRGYYRGYANRVLWPLFHTQLHRVEFQRQDLLAYERVNKQLARRLTSLLKAEDIIWAHDYHLIPLASELRRLKVHQPIGFFLHIPFPPYEVLRTLPGHEDLLRWLCAYDLLGFQTELDLKAFLHAAEDGLGARIHPGAVSLHGARTHTGVFPIGIDVEEVMNQAARGRTAIYGRRLLRSLSSRTLITGVDRLDYTKGLVERFRAYERLLERYPHYHGQVVFMQIAEPSRADVLQYQELRRSLEALAGEINGRYSDYDWVPLRYVNKGFARSTVLGFLALSGVGLITSLQDGMNLVAKEFTAAQDPGDPGALVLSKFAGAARELKDALLVNPYDIENVAESIAKAIEMPMTERRRRWESNMQVLRKHDITAWRRGFINMLRDCAADKLVDSSWQNRLSGSRYVAPTVDYLEIGSAIHQHPERSKWLNAKSVVTSTTRVLKSS